MRDEDNLNAQSRSNASHRKSWLVRLSRSFGKNFSDFNSSGKQQSVAEKSAKSAARASWAMVILTLAIGFVGYLQYTITKGQLEEMKSSSSQVERSIEAAMRQAAAIEAGNRARVVVIGVDTEKALSVGEDNSVRVHYRNIGKEPALNMRNSPNLVKMNDSGAYGTEPIDAGPNNMCAMRDYISGNNIAYPIPDRDYYFNIPLSGKHITNDVMTGELSLVLNGCIFYQAGDTIKTTAYCVHLAKGNRRATMDQTPFCAQGNSAN